jgi:dTDP-4-amino-4,6-dideoxygalactose transaminase
MVEEKGVSFVDLINPHLNLEEELISVVRRVLRSGVLSGGPVVEEFQEDFSRFCGVEHCVGVSSGTDALRFALIAAGVEPGDGVITVANTFVATVEAIMQCGATPHFVEVDPQTFNMSIDSLRDYLEVHCEKCNRTGLPKHRRTRRRISAVVPVHLYGQICDMDPILNLAERYGISVIEDACQAHGANYFSSKERRWKKAGSMGTAAAFSFYPTKNLGACGEAGAVTTNDQVVAQKIRMLRDHGQSKKYHHLIEGYNGRMDALQAGILQVKLRSLEDWNKDRRTAAQTYNRLLATAHSITRPQEPVWSRAVYHLYVIRAHRRDELLKHLSEKGIGAGLHSPIPLHLQQAFSHLGYREGDLPVSEKSSREILSLPIFPQIRIDQQEQVVEAVLQFYETQMSVAKTARA